jgi:membrane associated rhomboid family serine protease
MGIYDREYIRQGPSFLGSFAERGLICKWLIGINIVVFVLQMITRTNGQFFVQQPVTDALDLDVSRVMQGEVWRLLTYAFLHSTQTPFHILFNMLFLWWFGTDVEDLYGPREFLAFYLVSAFLGGLAFFLTHLSGGGICLGASGAVTAVLVVCAMHYPTRIILLFFILPVPIWLFVIFSVAQDMFGFLGGRRAEAEGVAFSVHLAGAFFGFVYYKAQWRLTNWWPQFNQWRKRISQPRLRVYRGDPEQPAPVPASASAQIGQDEDEQLEAKVDAVLEKLSQVGKENLTESEKAVLLRASELFKRRRR